MLNGMPDIPDFKGVVSATQGAAVGFGGAVLLRTLFGKVWGIVNEFGVPIVLADSVVGLTFDSGNDIANLPVERGSFSSYNKVNNPDITTVQMNKSSGGALQRGAFLTQLKILSKSTLTFNIISPEYVYMSYSIVGIGYARTANEGTTLLKVNLDMQEVRQTKVEYSFEEVQQPSDATTKDGGAKQSTQEPNESALSQIVRGIFG